MDNLEGSYPSDFHNKESSISSMIDMMKLHSPQRHKVYMPNFSFITMLDGRICVFV